jgi:Restriction endonuclease EcoRII, N-terminal
MTMKKTFNKTLSANDVGTTGGHQGGILIPKKENELRAFLPHLDPSVKNPDAWLECRDENGNVRRFRFVYYNNKLHDPAGTRNEYRITYMTGYFRDMGAREKDIFEISKSDDSSCYNIKIVRPEQPTALTTQAVRIKIRSGWQRVH